MGARARELERRFAAYVGAREAIAVNTGRAALDLALETVRLHSGDEVIVGADATLLTAEAIARLGARPVVADVTADTLTLDPQDAARRVTGRTRAIVPGHFGGHPCDMDGVFALAARHHLHVVEDAAPALGATYRGRRIGSVGELTVFGFGPDRLIAVEAGGMLTTEDAQHAARMRAWRAGRPFVRRDDLAMPEATAVLAIAQLHSIERRLGIRAYYAGLYQHGLSDLAELRLPEPRAEVQPAWAVYVVRLDLGRIALGRDAFIAALAGRGVRAEPGFEPVRTSAEEYPRAHRAAETALALPLDPRMSEADVWDVIHAVRAAVADHRRPGRGPRVT